jgi:haloalkane dehalogenase
VKDPILGRALKRHRAALPRARVTEVDAGHFLQEEAAGAIAEAVRRLAGLSV